MTTTVLRNGTWQSPNRSDFDVGATIARRIRAWLRLQLRLLKLKEKRLQGMREGDVALMDDHMRRDIGLDPQPRRPSVPEIGWL